MELRKGTRIALLICLLPGMFLIFSGVLLMFVHSAANALFDMHGQNALENNPLATAIGIRQCAIGLMIVTLASYRQVRALGFVMAIGAVVPLVDFYAFISTTGLISSMRHAAPVPVILGLGLYLLRDSGKSLKTVMT